MPLTPIFVFADASFSKQFGIAVIGHVSTDTFDGEFLKTDIVFKSISETNNIRSELKAAIFALESCPPKRKIVLYSDCHAVCDLPSRREHLEKTNFISGAKNEELGNADLYRELIILLDRLSPELVWIKGHSSKKETSAERSFALLDKEVRKELRRITP